MCHMEPWLYLPLASLSHVVLCSAILLSLRNREMKGYVLNVQLTSFRLLRFIGRLTCTSGMAFMP